MPIPASQIVEVNPRVITPGGDDLDFNALFLSSSSVIPLSQFVLAFTSATDIGNYFGLDSQEYALAGTYFQGFTNSQTKPHALLIAPRVNADVPAFVRAGQYGGTLEDLQSISDGTFNITLGGAQVELSGINLTLAMSYSEAAEILQTAIQAWTPLEGTAPLAVTAATVQYSSTFRAFTVTSGSAGTDNDLAMPLGTVASAMAFDAEEGAVVSPGAEYMTPAANMEAVLNVTRNFVTFMSVAQLSAEDCVAFSAWAASQGVNYLHVFFDTNVGNTAQSPSGTIAQALTDANAGSVCGIYGDAKYAAFICGCAASIAYDKTNGTITLMFKGQSGLPATVTNGTVAETLKGLGLNFIGNYATRNDQFVFSANGVMWGEWKWIDAYLNAIWLNNALQVACMNGFQNTLRVPYTEEGYTIVRSWCLDPINRALRSGVIEPGVTLSESQRSEIQREAGKDISSQLFTDGYYLKVEDPSPAVRQQRGTPDASLWFTYGGSIHKLELASTSVV